MWAPFASARQNTENSSLKRQVSNRRRAASILSLHSSNSSKRRATSSLFSPSKNPAFYSIIVLVTLTLTLRPFPAPSSIPTPHPVSPLASRVHLFFFGAPTCAPTIGLLVVRMRCSELVHMENGVSSRLCPAFSALLRALSGRHSGHVPWAFLVRVIIFFLFSVYTTSGFMTLRDYLICTCAFELTWF